MAATTTQMQVNAGKGAKGTPHRTCRDQLNSMKKALDQERQQFVPTWQDIGDYIVPMRPRFTLTDSDIGSRGRTKIIDNTATRASGTLRSGMSSGMTSPARQWFRLTTPNRKLNELQHVKTWLADTSDTIAWAFGRGNLYKNNPILYGDVGNFGTGAVMVEEDLEDVMRFYVFAPGTYWIGCDARGRVNKFVRELRMTVSQVIEKFATRDDQGEIVWKNISLTVKILWENGEHDVWINVCHAIYPNEEYYPNRMRAKYKKFRSTYYELGTRQGDTANTPNYLGSQVEDDEKILRDSGYDWFPVLVPRWEVSGEDSWGTDCPGFESLPDVKTLQKLQRKILKAVDKMIDPPMKGPTSLRTKKVSILSGDMTFVDTRDGSQSFEPAHNVNFRIDHAELTADKVRDRIKESFFVFLFLMMAEDDRRTPATAREIEERHQEKIQAVGPVLEQLIEDYLAPLIDIAYMILERQGYITEPPAELQGEKLKVEYVSIMAQAAKLVGIGNIERFFSFIGNAYTVTQDPSVLDKVDMDQAIDRYADRVGIDPDIIRSDGDVAKLRESRNQGLKQKAAIEQAEQISNAAKNLGTVDMESDTALTRLARQAPPRGVAA